MKFDRLELLNWDIQPNQEVLLQPGVNLLTGENGSGKTSILDAIKAALGVTRLGGDRSVDQYLRHQSAAYAMVRLVADNRADASGRRPLDVLGAAYDADLATFAVVFEAGEEGYAKRWYLLNGDQSPLAPGFDDRVFTRLRDYHDRLDRLGMGKSFRQLLRTPQGQIAGLCAETPSSLFALLFDFIGGKQVHDEWRSLRDQFTRQQRARTERADTLKARMAELERLRERLGHHNRLKTHLGNIERAKQALPLSKLLAVERDIARNLEEAKQQRQKQASGEQAAELASKEHRAAVSTMAELDGQKGTLEKNRTDLVEQHRTALKASADLSGEWLSLDRLRQRALQYPARNLDQLIDDMRRLADDKADLRNEQRALAEQKQAIDAEREKLEAGLLMPPEGVEAFQETLRLAGVSHELLMNLLDPGTLPAAHQRALESVLGDMRFAVAVPDIKAFVRAVALAREHRFPFAVLAPDVRSRLPEGDHPFLDHVRAKDPRYRGLVTRVLRSVGWLEGAVEDTHRARGLLVDQDGYVLSRTGGRYQGTDRFYLGRDALEKRRAVLVEKTTTLVAASSRVRDELSALEKLERTRQREHREETTRLEWLSFAERHAHLAEQRAQVTARQVQLEEAVDAADSQIDENRRRHADQRDMATRAALRKEQAEGAARMAQRGVTALGQAAEAMEAERVGLRSDVGEFGPELRRYAEEMPPTALERELAREQSHVEGFSDAVRDPSLPMLVKTLSRQVDDVTAELKRLDSQVEEARLAAERAQKQYAQATRRVFKHYFALLARAGEPLGLELSGVLRPRDEEFEVELTVAVGDKAPVAFDSPNLSGGQKAALSILMGMTTLQLQTAGAGNASFFLVDEPFSASDVHKIQELGTFLAQTGAQYLVSMPSSENLRRCGPWLDAVLTCTKTPGGFQEDGSAKLAPPVKVSYVVRDGH